MDCIFCKIANKEINSNFVYEDETVMAIMDISPVCDGHVLVIPKNHYETVFDVPKDILAHIMEVANNLKDKIMDVTNEKGITLTVNYGDKQEVKHMHLHILPNIHKPASKPIEQVYNEIMDK